MKALELDGFLSPSALTKTSSYLHGMKETLTELSISKIIFKPQLFEDIGCFLQLRKLKIDTDISRDTERNDSFSSASEIDFVIEALPALPLIHLTYLCFNCCFSLTDEILCQLVTILIFTHRCPTL